MSEMNDSGGAVETAESTAETTDTEPGEGNPPSEGYYIGGPELEAEIAGGDGRTSGDGNAAAGQDAQTESAAQASRGAAGGETTAEPGEGQPAGAPASDGYVIGGPELEKNIAIQEQEAPEKISSVETPYGPAVQGTSEAAISARPDVADGATLYRIGTAGMSEAGEAQFWSLEHPSTPGFAGRHGMPPENVSKLNFVEQGHLSEGVPFVTREAPPVAANPGGGIEVVVPPGGVRLSGFSYLGEEGLVP